jgi:hypothetical protein
MVIMRQGREGGGRDRERLIHGFESAVRWEQDVLVNECTKR